MLLYWYHCSHHGRRIDVETHDSSIGAHFLHLLHGQAPTEAWKKAMHTSLILYAKHGGANEVVLYILKRYINLDDAENDIRNRIARALSQQSDCFQLFDIAERVERVMWDTSQNRLTTSTLDTFINRIRRLTCLTHDELMRINPIVDATVLENKHPDGRGIF